jgi:hypothetical protein
MGTVTVFEPMKLLWIKNTGSHHTSYPNQVLNK